VAAIIKAHDAHLTWVVDADIADCFGSIPLNILMGQVKRVVPSPFVIRLIEDWLFAPVQGTYREVAGVSQGGVISPLLANLYLHRFDEMIVAALPESRLVRFADDFVILCKSKTEAVWALDVARRSLENLKLRLNVRKTRLTNFEEGFTFLGVQFKGRWCQLTASNGGDPVEEEE
jgi:Retron-type reverse transcriptase